jgi:uncharacterized protein (TIGR00369 family)
MATFLAMAKEMMDGRRAPAPIAALLGFRMIGIEEGRARFELQADERLANPMGTLHGGVLCDIADAAMGMAYGSTLQEGETFTTLELKINFLRPVWRATLVAEGTIVSRGKNVGMAECVVTDDKGRPVAKATCTCLTLRGEQASGR